MARQLQSIDNYSFQKVSSSEHRRINLMSPSSFTWYSTPPATPITPGAFNSIGSIVVPPGRCYIVNEINVHATSNCVIYLNISQNGIPNLSESGAIATLNDPGLVMELSDVITDTTGGSVKFTFPQPLLLWEATTITASYARSTATALGAQLCMSALDVTSDFNYGADKRIAVVGDSITWTSGGQYTAGRSYWPFLVTSYQRSQGNSIRLINKGFGGATSIEVAVMVRSGYINFDFDLLFVNVGMNDSASGATSEADYKASLNLIIQYAKERNPRATVILLGPPATDDPTRTPYIANYRTYAQQVAATYSSGERIYYIDLSQAYTSADLSDFTEQVTPRIHPNKSGHQKIATLINNYMINNGINI